MNTTEAILIFVGGVFLAAVISWLFRRSRREPLAVGVAFLIVLLSSYSLTRAYGGWLSFIAYAVWVTVVAAAFTFAYAKLRKR
jgi:CHASE2 domain-containing sensor protein